MYLYFLRHGEADWPNWKKSDDERPLTKRGKKEMHEVAKFLARIKARPALIVTSPLPRALQTAEIASEHLKVKCQTDKLLAPGFGLNHLKRLFEKYPEKSLVKEATLSAMPSITPSFAAPAPMLSRNAGKIQYAISLAVSFNRLVMPKMATFRRDPDATAESGAEARTILFITRDFMLMRAPITHGQEAGRWRRSS